jgi:hypothetical protein
MCSRVRPLATGRDQKKLLLARLSEIAHGEALTLATAYLGDPQVAGEAAAATVRIATRVGPAHRKAAIAALKQVLEATKDRRRRRDAERALKRLTGTP